VELPNNVHTHRISCSWSSNKPCFDEKARHSSVTLMDLMLASFMNYASPEVGMQIDQLHRCWK